MTTSYFHEVSRFFAKESLNVSKEWLEACISWCLEQGVNNVKECTYQQWLETDISVDGTQDKPHFPSNEPLESRLPAGKYTVQVQNCYDIATPAYSQLHKLKKSNLENARICADEDEQNFKASWQPKSSRMLHFVFHDGFRIFKGLEHESLGQVLPDPVPLGLKLTLQGPLSIRRGHILLVKGCLKVLGGHVEELQTNNGLEKFLSDLLENPETNQSNTNFPKCRTFMGKPGKIKFVGGTPSSSLSSSKCSQLPSSSKGKESKVTVKLSNPFDDDDDDIFSEMPIPDEENIVRDKGPKYPFEDVSDKSSTSITRNDFDVDFMDDDLLLMDEGPLCRTQSIISTIALKPFQYLAMASREYGEVITVKVCITTLSSKLSMKAVEHSSQRIWHINVIITDGSDTIEAEISHKILSQWIGFTPTEYAITCKSNPEKKEELKSSISSISNKLLKFNGLMKIKFHSREEAPVIFEVLHLNPGHLQQFKKRQK